jgi:branched-chain amino acid transport system ATP-binding protein
MPILEVRNLTKKFGGLAAVNDLSFHLEEGEILALIGPNGAGKSTVFNLITSFLRLTSGSISFFDKDITNESTYKIAAKGLVRTFQQNNLFKEMSVLENMLLSYHVQCNSGSWGFLLRSLKARRDEVRSKDHALECLEYFGLLPVKEELAKNLPHGLQRNLGMAIGLATSPKVLLMDEPFAGMNPNETDIAMNKVEGLKENGISIILVEHDMKAVRGISDRIVVMSFGEKIAEGNEDYVFQNKDVIDAYLGEDEEE